MSNPMSELSLTPLDSSFTVLSAGELEPVSEAIKHRVQRIWEGARRELPDLFDGPVLCVRDFSAQQMNCYQVPYRYIYAQNADAEIAAQLNLRAAAVSGLLRLKEKVFVGERSAQVTQGRGKLELVPSGGLPASAGTIDYRSQLLSELAEEVQVESELVSLVEPFALVEDTCDRVVDICCEIVLKEVGEATLLNNFKAGEYRSLECYAPAELMPLMEASPERWLPLSALLVRYRFGS